jgi:hypothetical protein
VGDVRASDADRERVADLLRRHCNDGRLTLDELGDRLAEVYACRYLGELNSPTGPLRELPVLPPPRPDEVSRRLKEERRYERPPPRPR